MGLPSNKVTQFRQWHTELLARHAASARPEIERLLAETRNSLADLIDSRHNNVALVPNFSLGFNMILDGLDRGHKVLLLQGDYPSVNWPVEQRKFETCYATIDQHIEDNIIQAMEQERPSVFCFSIVQYISGIKLSKKFITQLKADYEDVLFIADGTQYIGTEFFSQRNTGIDIIGASCYKWLVAGYGNGFFSFRSSDSGSLASRLLDMPSLGFNSKQELHDDNPVSLVAHLEPGHLDSTNLASILHGIKTLQACGLTDAYDHIEKLKAQAKKRFAPLLSQDVNHRDHHSTIFNIKGDQALFDKLTKQNIQVSQRGDGIRFGVHVYNTMDDLDVLARACGL